MDFAAATRREDFLLLLASDAHVGLPRISHGLRRFLSLPQATLAPHVKTLNPNLPTQTPSPLSTSLGPSPVSPPLFSLPLMLAKLQQAAHFLASLPPQSVLAVASPSLPNSHRASMKFSSVLAASPIALTLPASSQRWTPGALTNQKTPNYVEPRAVIVSDPREDIQAVREAQRVGIPVIALCNSDANVEGIDIVIPCNNRGRESVGVIYWLLCREILTLRGVLKRGEEWDDIPVDLFFYRDLEKEEREREEREEAARREAAAAAFNAPHEENQGEEGAVAASNTWEEGGANEWNQE